MSRFVRALGAGLAAALIAGTALAGIPVQLRGELSADQDGPVTLGDLFENAGRAAEVPVSRAPTPGGTVILDPVKLQQIAAANGLTWTNPQGYTRLVVKDAGGSTGPAAARAGRTVQALTWARNIGAGEIVQAEDVVWAEVQSHLAPADAPRDAEAVIGQAAKRPLRAGAAVGARDVAAAQVIKKGDLIAVTYSADGVSLTLQAQALQNAAVGDAFSVLNPQSKKTIVAVATGPGSAAVGPEADSLKASRFASR